jgi:LemA protein
MKKGLRILIAIALFGFIAGTFSSCGYNALVTREEAVTAQWSQVENVYQRRLDLTPQLVETVRGAANFERTTLQSVIEARNQATKVTVDPKNLSADDLQKFEQAQNQFGSAMRNAINVVVEQYPDIKATANFSQLQESLESSENRISIERKKFIEVVQDYNTYRRRFPTNITAGLFGFEAKGTFHANPGAENAPKIDFDDMKDKPGSEN